MSWSIRSCSERSQAALCGVCEGQHCEHRGVIERRVRNYIDRSRQFTERRSNAGAAFRLHRRRQHAVATARAMLNDDGEIVRVVIHGLVPLSGDRRGEDVMLTDALGFDFAYTIPAHCCTACGKIRAIRVRRCRSSWSRPIRPGAMPIEPTCPIRRRSCDGDREVSFVGQGAYVDLGYGFGHFGRNSQPTPRLVAPWFFAARALSDVYLLRTLPSDLQSTGPGLRRFRHVVVPLRKQWAQ